VQMGPRLSSTLSAPISVSSRLSGALPRSAAFGDLSQSSAAAGFSKASLARRMTRANGGAWSFRFEAITLADDQGKKPIADRNYLGEGRLCLFARNLRLAS